MLQLRMVPMGAMASGHSLHCFDHFVVDCRSYVESMWKWNFHILTSIIALKFCSSPYHVLCETRSFVFLYSQSYVELPCLHIFTIICWTSIVCYNIAATGLYWTPMTKRAYTFAWEKMKANLGLFCNLSASIGFAKKWTWFVEWIAFNTLSDPGLNVSIHHIYL